MAQIDLRHADIYLKDGYFKVGAINQPGGYPIGATTIAVDGFTTVLANASTFLITGDVTVYSIVSTVGGSTPTSITFTPGLVQPVADNAVVTNSWTGGAVNNVAGFAIGSTTIDVDGLAHAIPNGSTVKFSGHATTYTITGSTGGATPTDFTIGPLTSAVVDNETFTIFLAGAVNKPGTTTPLSGATSITVDGFSVAIPNGNFFTIAGSTRTYTVVSTTGGATPTAIVFTPALATADGLPVDNAAVSIQGNVLNIKIGEGNLTFEEKKNFTYVREKRSIINGFVMSGDDEPVDVSIDLIWEYLSAESGNPPTPEEALNKTGQAASWVTAGSDLCEPYALDVEVIYIPPCDGVKAERILLEEFRWESISHDLKAATMSVKGKCKRLLSTNTRETSTTIFA